MKLNAFILLLLLSCSTYAQSYTDWSAFGQILDASPYAGKKFRLQGAVKVQAIDPDASGMLWVRVDKLDKTMGFFDNMHNRPIRKNGWAVYTIEGKIDKTAKNINFGGIFNHKGIFYFDDFHFSIMNESGQWDEVNFANKGWESDTAGLTNNWHFFETNKSFIASITQDSVWEGKRSLRVDGSHARGIRSYGDNDSTGRYAEVNGIKIYYEQYGQGSPLLLLHGNRGDISDFSKQIPQLAGQFHVIAVDSRGQGHSSEDGKLYTYDLFAADMNALLDYLHLDSVNVLGWSDGGNTGLIMAMNYPRKVKKLAVMGANIFIDNTVVGKDIFRILKQQRKEFQDDSSSHGRSELRFITLLETEPIHRFEELGQIGCPVLVMAGNKDVIKEEHTKAIAAHIPQGQLLIFPKGTHEYPKEFPAEFNKTVIDFFQEGRH
jgi:pimeloyl-ACP methyl ester carboxylesterase